MIDDRCPSCRKPTGIGEPEPLPVGTWRNNSYFCPHCGIMLRRDVLIEPPDHPALKL